MNFIIHRPRKITNLGEMAASSISRNFTPHITSGKLCVGFTLLELLIVIGILAILATVAIIVINPGEYLKRSRDTKRMGDLSTLHRALGVIQSLNPNVSMGNANTVYISIPDNASSTCGSLGLPSLPSNWQYRCVHSDNLYKTNGQGWIPVDFTSAAGVSSILSTLPVDPVNSTTSGQYYTYVTGGSWELNAVFESEKYFPRVGQDGGDSFSRYEVGSSLTINPQKTLWSGIGNFENSADGFSSYSDGTFVSTNNYGTKVGIFALYIKSSATLGGGGNYGGIWNGNFPSLTVGAKYTISIWVKNISGTGSIALSNQSGGGDNSCLSFGFNPTNEWKKYSNTCVLNFVKPILYIWSNIPNHEFAIDGLEVEAGG